MQDKEPQLQSPLAECEMDPAATLHLAQELNPLLLEKELLWLCCGMSTEPALLW